ncbi:uncharacterized protein YALI1_C26209g [Yarrowia lipolytica]|uniref:Uncharacterized protein n=1 Tax=Yarrowia lipolytica TaxID=4952 RepID=A0A1D8NBQ7_YARLL|nr:hypothetical protein YALI1_C26209g [Yarrowia lipolytica]
MLPVPTELPQGGLQSKINIHECTSSWTTQPRLFCNMEPAHMPHVCFTVLGCRVDTGTLDSVVCPHLSLRSNEGITPVGLRDVADETTHRRSRECTLRTHHYGPINPLLAVTPHRRLSDSS